MGNEPGVADAAAQVAAFGACDLSAQPCSSARRANPAAWGDSASVTGSTASCTGASQPGKAPPWTSVKWPTAQKGSAPSTHIALICTTGARGLAVS